MNQLSVENPYGDKKPQTPGVIVEEHKPLDLNTTYVSDDAETQRLLNLATN